MITETAPVTEASPTNQSRQYAIYKPNAHGSGGVIRFDLNVDKSAIFVDAASQSGERQFDWEKKFTMKWGLSDIGAALAALQGRTVQAKLFHKTDYANSACELVKQDDPERAPFIMSISTRRRRRRSCARYRSRSRSLRLQCWKPRCRRRWCG